MAHDDQSSTKARIGVAASRDARPLTAEQAAWLVAVPCAAATVLAILVLGPPLAGVAFPPLRLAYWPESLQGRVRPEELEQARFAIALTAPLLLTLGTLALRGRRVARAEALTRAAQLVGVAALAGCLVAQWTYVFRPFGQPPLVIHYFSARTLVAAGAIAGAIVLASRRLRGRPAELLTRDAPRLRLAAWIVAAVMVAVTVLPAIQTDGGIAAANHWVLYHTQFTFDETLAVVNGRSPLGDFAAQYSSLWPYLLATTMGVVGVSVASFTVQLALMTALSLLALFDVLRRVTRSSAAALLLFLPVMATSAFRFGTAEAVDRDSLVTYYGTFPLRYAGPLLLAWLTARQLDGARPRSRWPLFLAAGLVAINNTDFGIPAAGATALALLVTHRGGAAGLVRLAREAAIGLAAAIALVAALVALRTGAAPHPELMVEYAKVFVGGFSLIPMRPVVGVSTIIYLTYCAAIAVAVAKALDGSPDRVLGGLLMWSGVFGLGLGAYYMGHSIPEKLVHELPNWALTLALLGVVAIRRLAARPSGVPTLAEAACLFGLGVIACSLAQTPAPWTQLDRIGRHGRPPLFAQPAGASFVAAQTRPGEAVLVLTTLGHRTADVAGARDVEPYTGAESIQTAEQLANSVGALSRAGGRKLFLLPQQALAGQLRALRGFGFAPTTAEPVTQMQLWVRDPR